MRPIVAVIGTTGVGKSQLAVHLAKSLETLSPNRDTQSGPNETSGLRYDRGVVLSADSMQLYKGLDVITNKATPAEMQGVEHWGLAVVQPGQGGSWELGRWCTEAGKVMDRLPTSTLPIICGGTHYFIQHFLFPPPELSTSRPASPASGNVKGKSTIKPSSARWTPPHPHPPTPDLDSELERLLETFWTSSPEWPGEAQVDNVLAGSSTACTTGATGAATWTDSQLLSLHSLLAAVDPGEAGRWHWRDGRKVKRGLERWWERGGSVDSRPLQDDSVHQSGSEGKRRKARFRTLIFWVYEPLETLRPRLNRRVDKMVENGLLREIAEMRAVAEEIYGSVDSTDHTEGIFQAIGYKEFSALPLDIPNPTSHPSFGAMLERMKLSTHQYAKSQLKWIRNQLLPAVREARSGGGEVVVYVVPGGEANEGLTREIMELFLDNGALPNPKVVGHPDASQLLAILEEEDRAELVDIASRQTVNARKDCPICSTPSAPYSIMLKEWETHIRSKVHKRNKVAAEGGREALIAKQKEEGLKLKTERERLRQIASQRQEIHPP